MVVRKEVEVRHSDMKGSTPDESLGTTPSKNKKKMIGEASDNNHPLKAIQNKQSEVVKKIKQVRGLTNKNTNVRKGSAGSGRKLPP